MTYLDAPERPCEESDFVTQHSTAPEKIPARTCPLADLDKHYRRRLQSFFQRRGCSTATSEDLIQDVFLRTVTYYQSNEIKNPSSFVFQIAANLLRDMARSAKRRQMVSLETSEPTAADHLLIDPITPERILEGRQDIFVATRALEELDARTRKIFMMSRLERWRHREIADDLGLSVSLIEKSIRSAHNHIETYVSQEYRMPKGGVARMYGG